MLILDLPGVALLIYTVADPFFVHYTSPRPATVVYLNISHGRKHSTSYHVGYSYDLDGKQRIVDENVNGMLYFSLHVGQTVQVCAARFGPFHYVEMKAGNSDSDRFGFLALAMIWNGIFFLYLLVWLLQPRRLVRVGTPTVGQITEKHVESGNFTWYCLKYGFQTPNGQMQDRLQYVARKFYEQAAVGENVVVLFKMNGDRSCQSRVYDYCDYEAA